MWVIRLVPQTEALECQLCGSAFSLLAAHWLTGRGEKLLVDHPLWQMQHPPLPSSDNIFSFVFGGFVACVHSSSIKDCLFRKCLLHTDMVVCSRYIHPFLAMCAMRQNLQPQNTM